MKKLVLNLCLLLVAMTWNTILFAQNGEKTLSPYFKIISENDLTESLPLKKTTADVQILGVIADVTIEQQYANTGSEPIEAVYVFPASNHAAIYHMEMMVGNRVIKAKIQEKGKARETYEQAKSEGKRTSLLEQERPNMFTMNVANILPGDQITVKLKYTENLIPESGVYSFIYPTVVGPRYTGEETNSQVKTVQDVPYTGEGIAPMYQFDLNVEVKAGMPLQHVMSTTHNIDVTYNGLEQATIELDSTESKGGNRDFVLEYQLAGKEINSGLLVYEGEKENHFLLTIQPPQEVTDQDIPQREYIFVVDVSGSMNGFPLDVSKNLMRNLLMNIRPTDKFNVVLFASSNRTYAPESVFAEEEEIQKAIDFLNNTRGGGGTQLLAALNKTVNIPKCEEGFSRSVVIVTDGYISVEREVFDLIRQNQEFNFFSFGIGSSVNRHLIDGIAHAGGGRTTSRPQS